jgi:hypothetical protein
MNGPLAGVPYLIKDLAIFQAREPARLGSSLYADFIADHDHELASPHWLQAISARAPHLRKAPPGDMQRSYSPVIVTTSVFGILPPGIALLRT